MIWQGLSVLWSHWRRNPWQLLTLLLGIALSTALWSGVQAINSEARASYAAASNTLYAQDLARITRSDRAPVLLADYVDLRRSGWRVSPVIEGELVLGDRSMQLIGIDAFTFPATVPSPLTGAGVAGEVTAGRSVALVHPSAAGLLDETGLSVVQDETMTPGTILTDIASADGLLQRDGQLSYMILLTDSSLKNRYLPDVFEVTREDDQADMARLTDSFHLNLTAFGLLSFAVGIFIVYGAVGLAFEQRRGVCRTLRALGFPLRQLIALLIAELTAFAVIAGLVGVGMGYVIAAALLPDVAATLRGLYGADVSGQLQLRVGWWGSGLAMALIGTGVASVSALYRLARMPVLAFNHPRAMSLGASRASRALAMLAIALMGAGALVATFADGLLAGFGLLSSLMLGAAFLLPWLLDRALAIAERFSKAPLAEWFWADSRQQLPGLSMALMALMLAMAANIGVSTMVSSFRLTFVGYLDQRLSSELYIAARDEAQAQEVANFLEGRVEALLPIVSSEIDIGGRPAEVFGVVDHATYRENWPLLSAVPEVWARLAAGDGVLINEQLSRRQNLLPGDQLPEGDGILGVYSDYGNPSGQVVMGAELFAMRYPDAVTLRYGIRTDEPDDIAAMLQERFELGEDALINQQDLKDFSVQVFERTFAVTGALNILTLCVAALAILISLLTLATMRLPQLAPVWALGMTRRALSRLELLRALCLAFLTTLISVPLGLLLAWVLLAIVNVEAFGWRLPMFIFPVEYLRLALLALLAAFAAALWPSIRLARTDPQNLLRVFSNER